MLQVSSKACRENVVLSKGKCQPLLPWGTLTEAGSSVCAYLLAPCCPPGVLAGMKLCLPVARRRGGGADQRLRIPAATQSSGELARAGVADGGAGRVGAAWDGESKL